MADEKAIEIAEPAAQPTSINDLRTKMKLTGRVSKIDLYGAFIDIGIGRDALVHISRLKKGRVNRVDEVLSLDQEVTVFVEKVDTKSGRVSLTMVKPLDVTWGDLKKGQAYSGKVTRLEQFGLFVDIGAERSGLVHISEMGEEYLSHPRDLYQIDQEIEVSVLNFDRKKKRIDLTLAREDTAEAVEEDEELEEPLTAMELALRKALEQSDSPVTFKSRQPRRRGSRRRKTQNDILNRTLQSRKS